MLQLPHVAELVGDEVVGDVAGPQEDDAVERVAVEAARATAVGRTTARRQSRTLLDPDRCRPPVEPVEARLGGDEPGVRSYGVSRQDDRGRRTSTAPPSCACWYSYG